MNVVGITTCVGPEYAGYLAKTLPVWMETLDKVVIAVGKEGVPDWLDALAYGGPGTFGAEVDVLRTDAFTRNDAHFNKGAALNEGIAAAKPTDWILSFDCDIRPPSDWREQVEKFARKSCLNGAQRYKPDGTPEDRRWYPRGYFQLWHVSSPHASPFDESSGSAAGYDTEFAERWTQEYWSELPFRMTHLGEKQKNWYGPGTTNNQIQEAVAAAVIRRRRDRRR